MNYQSATGLRCFMFSLGAVFASDPDTASKIATDNGLTGPKARLAHTRVTP